MLDLGGLDSSGSPSPTEFPKETTLITQLLDWSIIKETEAS